MTEIWTAESNTQAFTEGWGIWDCDGSDNGRWQLCRIDEDEVFRSDDEAWLFVVAKARCGSAYHQSALDFLHEHNQLEYDSIMKFVEKEIALTERLLGATP